MSEPVQRPYRILCVCTGNICRSPTAEVILRDRIAAAPEIRHPVEVDSAGTHGYHIGEAPDRRSQASARARGYDLSGLRARQLSADDFRRFDLLLAMDRGHLAIMNRMKPGGASDLRLLLDFAATDSEPDVPDPYYGGRTGFEQVIDLIETAVPGLITHLSTAAVFSRESCK